jgi:His-Xaa-Ser system radical SAM maturase HxsC
MLKLASFGIQALSQVTQSRMVARLTENQTLPLPLRENEILLLKAALPQVLPVGFRAYFIIPPDARVLPQDFQETNVFLLPQDQVFLSDGDVVTFDPERLTLRTQYRKKSAFNAFLVTERCNNYCLMCSQPPREVDDRYLVEELLQVISLMARGSQEVCLSGGEPTLLGDDLIRLIRATRNYLPGTSLHILSNGRNFQDLHLAQKVAAVNHPDLMIGIPLYSDISNLHDYVVQGDGAYDETIRGILNLKRCGVKVEIRVVLHKQTYERLPQLAEFIARNLLFVDQVALMGLEMTGFTKANLEALWIDPADYQEQLVEAIETLRRFKMQVSVYNLPLCILDRRLRPYNVKSISDWKNEYMPECEPCMEKSDCGGFFSSAKLKYSDHIKPILNHAS